MFVVLRIVLALTFPFALLAVIVQINLWAPRTMGPFSVLASHAQQNNCTQTDGQGHHC